MTEKKLDVRLPREALELLYNMAMQAPVNGVTLSVAANIADTVSEARHTLELVIQAKERTKKKPIMAQLHDTEVWDSTNENLLDSFTGSTALCDGIDYSMSINEECNVYYYNGSTWLKWTGPRPQNPPGR